MATPEQLRRAIAGLSALAQRDLAALWRQVSGAVEAREALLDVLPALIDKYGEAAGTLAADWYDDLRAEVGATGRFVAMPAQLESVGAEELARWGVAPLFQAEPDVAAARTLIDGGLQRRIANGSRKTIMDAASADPAASGWKRVGSGSCAFCLMLITRDQLYTEASADFASHDHCNCQAIPVLDGAEPIDVKDYVRSSRYIQDDEKRAKANALAREYLAEHPSA